MLITVIDNSTYWNPAWDNMDLVSVVEAAEPIGIAYETFAYYELFFGPNGLFQGAQNASTPVEGGTNTTAPVDNSTMSATGDAGATDTTTGDATAAGGRRFLQDAPVDATTTAAPVDATTTDDTTAAPTDTSAADTGNATTGNTTTGGAVATDAKSAYIDIDQRIKGFALELPCSLLFEADMAQEQGAANSTMPAEGGATTPVEGGAPTTTDTTAPATDTAATGSQ